MSEIAVDTLPPPEPPSEPPAKSAFARIIGVFFEPGATFADIARKPAFIAPLVLLMVFSAGGSFVVSSRVDMKEVILKQIEKSSRADSMTAQQKDTQAEAGAKVAKYIAYAAPIFTPIVLLIVAGALILFSNFIFGGSASFKQMFAVAAHGWLPSILKGIATVTILYLKDPSDVDIQNPIASNLGFVVQESMKFLHSLAANIDLFTFWQIFLLGTGISAAAKVSSGKGMMAVIIPWALLALCGAAFTLLQ